LNCTHDLIKVLGYVLKSDDIDGWYQYQQLILKMRSSLIEEFGHDTTGRSCSECGTGTIEEFAEGAKD